MSASLASDFESSTNVNASGLQRLPLELLVDGILAQLTSRDILRCSVVCKWLREVVQSSLALQYRIELGVEGLQDTSPGYAMKSDSITTSERMSTLSARRKSWRVLTWEKCIDIEIPGPLSGISEFVDGVFAKSDGRIPSEIVVSYLPSRTQDGKQIVHSPDKIGVQVAKLMINPTQDLLALIEQPQLASALRPGRRMVTSSEGELIIHLLSLQTGEPHSLAQNPVLFNVGCEKNQSTGEVRMMIADDVLGISLDLEQFLVWNWRSGELLVDHKFPGPGRNFYENFRFLSSRALVGENTKETGSIDIYTFRDAPLDRADAGTIASWTVSHGLEKAAILLLPPITQRAFYSNVDLYTWPLTINSNESSGLVLISCSWTMLDDSDYGRFRMITTRRALLKYVKDYERNGQPKNVPWLEWGPDATRIFLEPARNAWIADWRYSCTAGMRVVFNVRSNEDQDSEPVRQEVVEFGYHLARPNAVPSSPPNRFPDPIPENHNPSSWRERRMKTMIGPEPFQAWPNAGSPFTVPFETRLPYHSVTLLDLPYDEGEDSEMMIDEERLVSIRVRSNQV